MESGPEPLGDIVSPGLRVLLVGINPSVRSARLGAHFSSPGNPFWRLLWGAGLTPVLLEPAEAARLLDFGLGLTSVCSRPTGAAADLTAAELTEGARCLEARVRSSRPAWVALLGLTLAQTLLPGLANRGPGPRLQRWGGARLFVLPNPSGRNRAYPGFERKLVWYRELARVVDAS